MAEGLSVLDIGDLAVPDRQPFEDSRVVELARPAVGLAIGLATVLGEPEGNLEDLVPFGQRRFDALETVLNFPDLGGDPLLFAPEQGNVYGAGVVGLEQLPTLGLQRSASA